MALRAQRASWQEDPEIVLGEPQRGISREGGKWLRPDVLLQPDGMNPLVLEVEFEGGRRPDLDAEERIGCTTGTRGHKINTAIAIIAPQEARNWARAEEVCARLCEGFALRYAVISSATTAEETTTKHRWPQSGYIVGDASSLADLGVAAAISEHDIRALAERVAGEIRRLGWRIHRKIPAHVRKPIAAVFGQRDHKDAMSIAVCVWLNALLMHNRIANLHSKIPSLTDLRKEYEKNFFQLRLPHNAVCSAWRKIMKINYLPVFAPALESLEKMAHKEVVHDMLDELGMLAESIESARLGPLVDIGGELFPRLAADRKETAAFYTIPESAELLAHLAFARFKGGGKISGKARIADFACGTGALLRAAYRLFRLQCERNGKNPAAFHKDWMENGLHGSDIQPIAVHLTSAGLAGMEIGKKYDNSNIACLSAQKGYTGALELLEKPAVVDMFKRYVNVAYARKKEDQKFSAPDGSFDLCIMNPPYSRTRGGQRTFDITGLKEKEQDDSQQNLNRMLRGTFGNMKAGMGSAFAALADKKLRVGGVYASVLPLTAADAQSWRKFRECIARNYDDIVAVGIASDMPSSFSADTGMGEMLIAARKIPKSKSDKIIQTKKNSMRILNLHFRPRNFSEAAEIARIFELQSGDNADNGIIKIGDDISGEWLRININLNGNPWGSVGLRGGELAATATALINGRLRWLGDSQEEEITLPFPMTTLGKLFEVGPTHDRIGHPDGGDGRGAYTFYPIEKNRNTPRPALWSADAPNQRTLLGEPTHFGRGVKDREKMQKEMWAKSSCLFLSRNMRWTSQSLTAMMTDKKCMGGRAWVALIGQEASIQKAMCLWANSIFGMILRWQHGQKQQQGRSTMQIAASKLLSIPDFACDAAESARKIAEKEFAAIQSLRLAPAASAYRDDVRKKIDSVVAKMIGLSGDDVQENMATLRRLFCQEPNVHGGQKNLMKDLEAAKA